MKPDPILTKVMITVVCSMSSTLQEFIENDIYPSIFFRKFDILFN